MTAEIPAGWYPNPWNDAEELYWSGTEWTGISRTAHRSAPLAAPADAASFVSASEVEESTVMRPVGAAAPGSAAPVVGFEPPPPYAAPAAYAAPPAYSAPSYDPAVSYPQAPAVAAFEPAPPAAVDDVTYRYGHADQAGATDAPTYAAAAQAVPEFNTGTTQELPPYPGTTDATTIRWALGGAAPLAPQRNPRARFGLVSMILGIAAAVFAVVPGLSFAAWLPAFVAIALGIMAFLAVRPRGFALAGIITGGAALAVGTGVSIWFMVQLGALGH